MTIMTLNLHLIGIELLQVFQACIELILKSGIHDDILIARDKSKAGTTLR